MMAARFAVTCMFAALAIGMAHVAGAQAPEKKRDDNLDLTMTLLPEHAKGPEEITRRIELPPPKEPGEHKEDRSRDGDRETDSEKGDKGPPPDPGEQGRATAEQAR
jgi:hypothetical protein